MNFSERYDLGIKLDTWIHEHNVAKNGMGYLSALKSLGFKIIKGERKEEAEVTKYGLLDMQVCVPMGWTDEQVLEFAEKKFPCGTTGGWFIRRKGDKALNGAEERVPCERFKGHVHIMLDA